MQTEKEKEKGQVGNLVNLSKAFLMGICGLAPLHLVDFKLKENIWVSFHMKSWTKFSSANSLIDLGNVFTPLPEQCQVRKSCITSGKIQGKPRQEAEGSSLATNCQQRATHPKANHG